MKSILILLFVITFQHGFSQVAINTTASSPASSAMLDVSSTSKGMLMPRMTSAQRKAIVNPDGGLTVFDTDKQTLYMFDGQKWWPLMFNTEGNLPLTERETLGGYAQAKLGFHVAIGGNTAAAYSYQDNINGFSHAGSVSVFSKESGSWKFVTRLTPPVPQSSGDFGWGLAVENDVIVVGEPNFDKPGKTDAGAVHVYRKTGNSWNLAQELIPSQEMANANFGFSISMNNGRIAIGASRQTVGGIAGSGAVYVFKLTGNNYVEEKYLAPQMGTTANFGSSVALNGSNLLAGAPYAKQGNVMCGVAILHTLAQNTQQWTYAATWLPSEIQADMRFGLSLGLVNEFAVIGAYHYHINGTQYGRVERFKKSGNTWVFDGGTIGETNSWFGHSVSVSASGYLVGSPYEDDGRVRLFDLAGSEKKIYKDNLATEGVKGFSFGHGVAISGETFIIGIPNKFFGDRGAVQFGHVD